MKIAIIGSGIAGLTAAHLLTRNNTNHVTLIESSPQVGLGAHGFGVSSDCTADVPPRMFNTTLWPELSALYDSLGVASELVDQSQSFSVASTTGANRTYLRRDNVSHPRPRLIYFLNRTARKIAGDARRLMEEGREDLADDSLARISIDNYLTTNGYSHEFRYQFLYPTLSSTICTCSYEALKKYPADVILLALRDLTQDGELRRVSGGTSRVVHALTSQLSDIRTGCQVTAVQPLPRGALVKIKDAAPESFDCVVMATQANTANKLLNEIELDERAMLQSIRYQNVRVDLHRDPRLMPTRQSDWTTFNMISNADSTAAMCSVWMKRFHNDWPSNDDCFQTIGPVTTPLPGAMLSSVELQRPVVDETTNCSLAALDKLHSEPHRRIWYAGSWAVRGVPLLESAVVSAQRVVQRLHVANTAAAH